MSENNNIHRAASALLGALWQKVYSGSRTHEENWQQMDRQFPQARWLNDELKAASLAPRQDLVEAARAVEQWWLEDGLKYFDAAPYAIFAIRAALSATYEHSTPVSQSPAMSSKELRELIRSAIGDPGRTEGFRNDRSTTVWQTDAVMRVLGFLPEESWREYINSLASPAPAEKMVGSDDDETYEIGKRDGYSEAVQQIDQLTGGDGEYRYCTDRDPDRHTPGPAEMIQRIVDRFETLNLLRDAEKTGRDQEWGISAEPHVIQADHVALRDLVERAQAIISTSTYPNWHESARAALSAPEGQS